MRTIQLCTVVGLIILNPVVFAANSGNPSIPARSGETAVDAGSQGGRQSRLNKAQQARKSGDRELAISLYKEIGTREPGNVEARLVLASLLAEANRFDEARVELNAVQKIRPAWVQVYLTRAQVEQQARNEISALKAFNQALAIDPQNQTAREGKLLTLSRLGSPDIALTEAKEWPRVDAQVIQRLHEDKAAQAIRRSENAYHDSPVQALPALDAAIGLVEANLQRYAGSERSRFDYVRALANRNRHRDAIAVYEGLMAEKRDLPGYLHHSAGLAYLAEQQPQQARNAFQAALAFDPNDFNASVGLFYALCDLNKFRQAKTHIDALAARALEPEKKFQADMLAIWVRAYEARLGVAQDRFSALLARVPASTSLHNALGRIYLWRGWPRRAGKEFNYVAQRHPQDLEAQTGLLDVDMALADYRAAARRVVALNTQAPGNESVRRSNRVQALHRRPEFHTEIGTSETKERASTGQSLHVETRVYSAPLNFQNRLFAHQYYESARFDAGYVYYKRLGLGWESTIARVGKLEIEAQQEFYKENQTSVLVGGEIQFNDYWRIKGRYDSNSTDVPLRARVNDIDGKAIYLSSKYRLSERTAIDVNAQRLSMSDDNTRRSISASAGYQFIQGPFYKATVSLDGYASTNTLPSTQVVYFNPPNDRTVQLTLKNEWLGYRRYARSFYQRLYLSIGGYTQKGFDTESIGSVRYEHEWNFSDSLNTRYGLGYVRRVYDGEVSRGPEATLSVNWKF